jgi:hypothetical protein
MILELLTESKMFYQVLHDNDIHQDYHLVENLFHFPFDLFLSLNKYFVFLF